MCRNWLPISISVLTGQPKIFNRHFAIQKKPLHELFTHAADRWTHRSKIYWSSWDGPSTETHFCQLHCRRRFSTRHCARHTLGFEKKQHYKGDFIPAPLGWIINWRRFVRKCHIREIQQNNLDAFIFVETGSVKGIDAGLAIILVSHLNFWSRSFD